MRRLTDNGNICNRKDFTGHDVNAMGNETLVLLACGAAVLCLACLWLARTAALRTQIRPDTAPVAIDCESQVGERTRELSEHVQYLQDVREREKRKFARNLHDELGSLLIS